MRTTALPKGELPGGKLTDKQMMDLATELRKSELRKVRALRDAIASHEKQRAYLRRRSQPKAAE